MNREKWMNGDGNDDGSGPKLLTRNQNLGVLYHKELTQAGDRRQGTYYIVLSSVTPSIPNLVIMYLNNTVAEITTLSLAIRLNYT